MTFIDVDLLAGFTVGREIHILVDPAEPGTIAIDRAKTPLEIPTSET